MRGDGSAAEAMAALALTQEGFDVALPDFKQPSFDMISKWGKAIHTIQVKTGSMQPTGKSPSSGRPPTVTAQGFTWRAIAAISGWYWFRAMKSGGFHFQRSVANSPFAPTLNGMCWLSTDLPPMASKTVIKTVIENSGFQKSLQINGEVHPERIHIE